MAFQVSIPRPVRFLLFLVRHLVLIAYPCYFHLERHRGGIGSLALDVERARRSLQAGCRPSSDGRGSQCSASTIFGADCGGMCFFIILDCDSSFC